jgi:hypothetical protein
MTEIQNSKQIKERKTSDSDCNVLVIEIYNFGVVCNLSIVIWDFSAPAVEVNSFSLNLFTLMLTFP